jgi:hypothetical protein
MPSGLVQNRRKWKVGLKMGELEIIKANTGERTTFEIDGTILKDLVEPPALDWCDKGQHYALKANGRDINDMLWYCEACK